jgi:signal transduction histidine kinase
VRPSELFRTTSFRLALTYLGVFIISSMSLALFVSWSAALLIEHQVQDVVDLEANGLSERYRERGTAGLAEMIAERLRQDSERRAIYLLLAPDGSRIAGNLYGWPARQAEANGWVRFTGERIGDRLPAAEVIARSFSLPEGNDLLVGRVLTDVARVDQAINRALIWGLGLTIILGVAGAFFSARHLVRRLDSMSKTAHLILSGEMKSRMVLAGGGDEFDRLAQSFNDMMDEIVRLVDSIRTVTDNIAHDLRTPLNRLRSRMDLALMSDSSPQELEAALESAIADADHLLATFNALLAISQAESGTRLNRFVAIDPALVVLDVAELYEPLAQEKNQTLTTDLDEGMCILADRHLLFQTLANVVDNAVKYTPDGGCIFLRVKPQGDRVEVSVADTGPGIPEQEFERVLERFVRLDSTRTSPGNGLGLSLVRAVAGLHGASLKLENMTPGLKLSLYFPQNEPLT